MIVSKESLRYYRCPSFILCIVLCGAVFTTTKASSWSDSSSNEKIFVCGQYCLAMLLNNLSERPVTFQDVVRNVPANQLASLAQLGHVAHQAGMNVQGGHVTSQQLIAINQPAILHLRGEHFVAFIPDDQGYSIVDPPHFLNAAEARDVFERWTGDCLFVSKQKIKVPVPRKSSIMIGASALLLGLGIPYYSYKTTKLRTNQCI